MAELAKCPICESDTRISGGTRRFGWCPACGITGPYKVTDKLAAEAWNSLCEKIRVGKKALECVPDGFRAVRVGEPHEGDWVIDEHCNALKNPGVLSGVWFIIEPIPAPPSKDDVLRECKIHIGYRSGVERRLQSKIDAVLEAEE